METATGRATLSPASFAGVVWSDQWQRAKHIDLIDENLCRLVGRDTRRLMVWMPPQHGKSTLISKFFPAWYLGMNPTHRVILASYGHQFATRWGRAARDLLVEFGPEVFGAEVRRDVQAAHTWDMVQGGGMLATGVGGQITGHRADLLIIDDPVKNSEQAVSEVYREKVWEWWVSSASTRLRPDGLVVIVQTRWHKDDLSGRILREHGEGWHQLDLKGIAEHNDPLGRQPGEALWPEVYDQGYLEKVKRESPPYWWEAMYQQRPTQHESVLWPPDYFEGDDIRFDEWPKLDKFLIRAMALDPSRGKGTEGRIGDYSAYVMVGIDKDCRLWVDANMDNTRASKQLVADGVELCGEWRPHVFGVETNAFQELYQPMFVEGLRASGGIGFEPIGIENRVKKELRIERLDQWFRERRVMFKRTRGTDLLLDQLQEFPVGLHDDGPDALEMAVRLCDEYLDVSAEVAGTIFDGGLR